MNAKELILVKLNATSEFADLYSAALSTGMSFEDISNIMTSKIFNIVAKYTRKNLFDINTERNTLKDAIDFVLNEKDLKVIPSGLLKYVLTEDNDFLLNLKKKLESYNSKNSLLSTLYSQINNLVRSENHNSLEESDTYNTILQCLENVETHSLIKSSILSFIIKRYSEAESKTSKNNHYNEDALSEYNAEMEMAQQIDYELMNNQDLEISDDQLGKTTKVNFGSLKKEDYRDLYIYLKHYLFPKNEEIIELKNDEKEKNGIKGSENDSLSFEKQNLSTIKKLINIADEIKMNGKICGINQGVKNNNLDESNWVNDIDTFVNRKYYEYVGKVPDGGFIPFDLITFISDEEYRKKQIAQYDLVRSSINILKTITDVKHFSKMLNFAETNRKAVERAFIIKFSKYLYNDLLKKSHGGNADGNKKNNINYYKIIKLSKKSITKIREFARDVLIINWLNSIKDKNDYKFFLSYIEGKSISYYFKNVLEPLSLNDKQITISLNSLQSYGTIKHLIDWYIIPELQKLYPNNEFLKRIMIDGYLDKDTKKIYTYSRISARITNFEDNVNDTIIYDNILRDFKDIANLRLSNLNNPQLANISDIKIGDLFFLYNILENKDGFGKNSFTRLFEDLVSGETNNLTLVNSYYNFLYNLDVNTSDINSLVLDLDSKDPNDVNVENKDKRLKYHMSDLKWLVAKNNPNEAWKINTEINENQDVVFKENKGVYTTKDEQTEYPIKYPSLKSDPLNGEKNTSGDERNVISEKDKDKFPEFNVILMQEITKNLKELGINIDESDIVFYDGKADNKALDELHINSSKYRNAKGFVKEGKIYININKGNNTGEITGVMIHELSHIIAAIFKSQNRTEWYKIINSIRDKYKAGDKIITNLTDSIISAYYDEKPSNNKEQFMSDLFEEVLIHIIENNFMNNVANELNNVVTDVTHLSNSGIINQIKEIISNIFNIDSNNLNKFTIEDLSKCDIASFIKKFKSSVLNNKQENIDWSTGIKDSEWLITIKKKIFNKVQSIENC